MKEWTKFKDIRHLPREKQWEIQIKEAQEAENEVCAFLNEFFEPFFGRCQTFDYRLGKESRGDIYSKKRDLWFEVKLDKMADFTGNYFVEEKTFQSSESRYWVFVDNHFYSFLKIEVLEKEINFLETKHGGDTGKFRGWLYPKAKMRMDAKLYPRGWEGDKNWYRKYILKEVKK